MPCRALHLDEPTLSGDPNAKNCMMTKVWGPAGWLFLHCVTLGYPQDPDAYDLENGKPQGFSKAHYKDFFYEVGYILPCKYCRDSYREFMREDPVEEHLSSRDTLIKWLWDMHNKVNTKLGVKYCDLNYKDFIERYESYRAKCKAISPEERELNSSKGCITPADGTPKKCTIQVVATKKGDVTRRDNASQANAPSQVYASSSSPQTDQGHVLFK